MRRIVKQGRAAWRKVVALVVEKFVERLVIALMMASMTGVGGWWASREATAHEKVAVQGMAVKAMTQGVKAGQAMKKDCPHKTRRTRLMEPTKLIEARRRAIEMYELSRGTFPGDQAYEDFQMAKRSFAVLQIEYLAQEETP